MARQQEKLKLGKGSAFVKKRLLRLPQQGLLMEADFRPLSNMLGCGEDLWLMLVVSRHDGSILAQEILEDAPTVNNLAAILADAMQRPLTDENRCRPAAIHLRDNPEWEELSPHLAQLKIKVVIEEELHAWDETVGGLVDYLRSDQWKETNGSASADTVDADEFQDHLLNLRLAAIMYPVRRSSKR